jgi:regulator of sirC expression with transglutaminase-like and TPR domain
LVTRGGAVVVERTELLARLRDIGRGDDAAVDIGAAALLLAALDRPGVDLAPYHAHLDELADACRSATEAGAGVGRQLLALRHVVTRRFGYLGDRDTYDDIRNANLMHVIDRRKGLPVALGVLYLHGARAYGGHIVGVNFPSHFLVRLEARGQRVIFDPFEEAEPLDAADLRRKIKDILGADAEMTADCYRAVGNVDVLVRLQSNIKMRALVTGDLARALEVLETLTTLAPDRSDFWWETALVHYQRGNAGTAIRLLEGYLERPHGSGGVDRIEELLRRLKGRVQ